MFSRRSRTVNLRLVMKTIEGIALKAESAVRANINNHKSQVTGMDYLEWTLHIHVGESSRIGRRYITSSQVWKSGSQRGPLNFQIRKSVQSSRHSFKARQSYQLQLNRQTIDFQIAGNLSSTTESKIVYSSDWNRMMFSTTSLLLFHFLMQNYALLRFLFRPNRSSFPWNNL